MIDLIVELREQPQALRGLVRHYQANAGLLEELAQPRLAIFTGMGASYHAALIAAAHASALGVPALALEAIDLLNYQSAGLLQPEQTLVYISQSGKSVEVEAILRQNAGQAQVIAVTNQPGSPLGQSAQCVLPLLADQRFRLASKNYVNTLAVLWLLVRRWAGVGRSGGPTSKTGGEILLNTADRMEAILSRSEDMTQVLLDQLGYAQTLVFLGHGPHAATARQSALMLSEWARAAAHYHGIGAFRHGFVETVTPEMGALFFAPPGKTCASALELARVLPEFGVQVGRIAYGEMRGIEEPGEEEMDEFLSPLLDVVPMQLLADGLARKRGVVADFKFIDRTRKV